MVPDPDLVGSLDPDLDPERSTRPLKNRKL